MVTGTLGVLAYAAAQQRLDFTKAIQALMHHTRFRWTPEVIADARKQFEQISRELQNKQNPKP